MRRPVFSASIAILTTLAVSLAACKTIYPETVRPEPNPLVGLAEAAQSPVLGHPSAAAAMVEFFDFQCMHCKRTLPILDDLLKAYEGDLKIVSRPYMRAYAQTREQRLEHPSFRAAAAALAADRQGKYSEMMHALFANQSRMLESDLIRYAASVGLDVERFNLDRKDSAILSAVEANGKAADNLKIANTPGIVIGGKTYQGARDYKFYSDLVAAALGQAPVETGAETDLRAEAEARSASGAAAGPDSRPAPVTWNDMIFPVSQLEPVTSKPVLKVGDQAPDFTLPGACGQTFKLSTFRGQQNVIVSFVPAAFTPVCSGQWPHYIAKKDELDALDTIVLGITEDNVPSLYAWTRGMEGLNFPVLSDFWPHGATAKKYGVLRPEAGTSERALFLVDKKGVIRYIDIHDINTEPDVEPLMKAVRTVAQEK